MKVTFTEAMQMISELRVFVDLMNTPDTRWDGLQDWLTCHPRWERKVAQYTTITPDNAIADLKAYIEEKTEIPQVVIAAFITPEMETKAKSAIERLQTLYKERKALHKERKAQDAQPRGYISEEWIVDNNPIPSGHKTIDDYQQQLKAKKKRRKKA